MYKLLLLSLFATTYVLAAATAAKEMAGKVNVKKCDKRNARKKIKKCRGQKNNKRCSDFPGTKQCKKSFKDDENNCDWWGKCGKVARKQAKKVTSECPTDIRLCQNVNNFCSTWAANGECIENSNWMQRFCSGACCPLCNRNTASGLTNGKCPNKKQTSLCLPDNPSPEFTCNAWQKKKECKKNQDFMLTYCMSSCCPACKRGQDRCPTVNKGCKNTHKTGKGSKKKKLKAGDDECKRWASLGQCQVNPNFMNRKCAVECCPFCRVSLVPAVQPINTAFGGYGGVGFPFLG